jgi:hypothetical protein
VVKTAKIYATKQARTDLTFVVLLPAAAALLTLALPVNLMASTVLFFGAPVLYLSLRNRSIVRRSFIFATCIALISILTDYLAERDQSWTSTSMFPTRILGAVPVEAIVWTFLFTYLIVAFYLHFYRPTYQQSLGKRMPVVFVATAAVLAWAVTAAFISMQGFVITYFYIKFGIAMILLPLVAFAIAFPGYIRIFLQTSPYFFALGFVNVLVSLAKGHWVYVGEHFIGWVSVGNYRFPAEELIFWMILYSSFIIAQFEFFTNDRLKRK